MTLNGQPVGRPDGGVSPLIAGVDVSSSNLTPPLPGSGAGILSAGQIGRRHIRSARERRRAARHGDQRTRPSSTRAELPNLLTDGDGNPATGPEPTVVVVGNLQLSAHHEGRLRRRRRAGARGRDARVRRASHERRHRAGLCRRDPRRHRGADAGVSHVRGSVVVAERLDERDHGRRLAADRRLLDDLRRAAAGPHDHAALPRRAERESRHGHARHEHGHGLLERSARRQRARASRSTSAALPGIGIVNGRVWHDADFDTVFDANEIALEGWAVELYRNGSARARRAHGRRRRLPHRAASTELRDAGSATSCDSAAPGAGASTAMLGRADSDVHATICSGSTTSSCCRAATC